MSANNAEIPFAFCCHLLFVCHFEIICLFYSIPLLLLQYIMDPPAPFHPTATRRVRATVRVGVGVIVKVPGAAKIYAGIRKGSHGADSTSSALAPTVVSVTSLTFSLEPLLLMQPWRCLADTLK